MAGHGRSSIQIGSNRSIVDMKIGINPINSILLFYLKVPVITWCLNTDTRKRFDIENNASKLPFHLSKITWYLDNKLKNQVCTTTGFKTTDTTPSSA